MLDAVDVSVASVNQAKSDMYENVLNAYLVLSFILCLCKETKYSSLVLLSS